MKKDSRVENIKRMKGVDRNFGGKYGKSGVHKDKRLKRLDNCKTKDLVEMFKEICKHENLIVVSYKVDNSNAPAKLIRNVETGKVVDVAFERGYGDVSESVFFCKDCGEELTWFDIVGYEE